MFPAYRRPAARGPAATPATGPTGASCFVHDGRPAVAACDQCGRFLCAVCELELDGQPWCAACLAAARATGRLARLERQRVRWDLAAGYLLAGSLLLCPPLLLLTAPAAMVLAGGKLHAPPSRVARSRLRLILVFPVALLLLGGLALLAWREFPKP
ncbi:MAG: B-box zinc finger protein [Verrucomicrobiota bacterium]